MNDTEVHFPDIKCEKSNTSTSTHIMLFAIIANIVLIIIISVLIIIMTHMTYKIQDDIARCDAKIEELESELASKDIGNIMKTDNTSVDGKNLYLCPFCGNGLSLHHSSYLATSAQFECSYCSFASPEVYSNKPNDEIHCIQVLKYCYDNNKWNDVVFLDSNKVEINYDDSTFKYNNDEEDNDKDGNE